MSEVVIVEEVLGGAITVGDAGEVVLGRGIVHGATMGGGVIMGRGVVGETVAGRVVVSAGEEVVGDALTGTAVTGNEIVGGGEAGTPCKPAPSCQTEFIDLTEMSTDFNEADYEEVTLLCTRNQLVEVLCDTVEVDMGGAGQSFLRIATIRSGEGKLLMFHDLIAISYIVQGTGSKKMSGT